MFLSRMIKLTFLWLLVGLFSVGTARADHMSFAVTMLATSPSALNQQFKTLLHNNQTKQLRTVIESGVDLNSMDSKRVAPIHYAAYLGNVEILQMMVDHHVNVHAMVFGGWNPLHYAAYGGQVEAGKFLVAQGIDINSQDVGGETPLFYAVEAGFLPMVQWLVFNGADVNKPNNDKETPLSLSEHHAGNKDISNFLRAHSGKVGQKVMVPQDGHGVADHKH